MTNVVYEEMTTMQSPLKRQQRASRRRESRKHARGDAEKVEVVDPPSPGEAEQPLSEFDDIQF